MPDMAVTRVFAAAAVMLFHDDEGVGHAVVFVRSLPTSHPSRCHTSLSNEEKMKCLEVSWCLVWQVSGGRNATSPAMRSVAAYFSFNKSWVEKAPMAIVRTQSC